MSKDKRTPYQIVGPATWELVRAAYLAGDSARAVSERFNVSEAAIRRRATKEHWTKRDYAVALEQQGIEPPPKPKPLNVAERFAANYTPPPRVAPGDEPHPFADLITALREANGAVEAHKAASDAAFVEEPAAAAAALERQALAQVREALAKGKAGDARTLAGVADQMRKRAEEEAAPRVEEEEGTHGFPSVAEREEYIADMFHKIAWVAGVMVFNPSAAPGGFLMLIKRWREINLGEGEDDAEEKARKIAKAAENHLNGDWLANLPEDLRQHMQQSWDDKRRRISQHGVVNASVIMRDGVRL